ncbi:MAG TPA: hypothetical protein DHU33_03995 [Firmicutes bacterium]|nr:hypothetical protein [Bacillota bacterium]
MKFKKTLLILLTLFISSLFIGSASALTINDNGKYSLILNSTDGEIDGSYSKIIKFDLEENETTVSIKDLTKDITPFYVEYKFAYWGKSMSSDEKIPDEVDASMFSWSGTYNGVEYTNGLTIWAKFSNEKLQGSGTYYLFLDGFAGKINGQDQLKLISKESEFQTVDLSKYIPTRDGYTFIGWDYKGTFVTSIDKSYFKECDVVTITAVYTKNTFDGDYIVLKLNANGGTIDGKEIGEYDYVGGQNSGTSMPIFHYIPIREGYTFNGWNTKKDGSGKNLKYMYWRSWYNDTTSETPIEFERDTLVDYMYHNLTLYATWTKNTTEETTKEITSSSTTKGSIIFDQEVSNNYRLDIKEITINDNLLSKNVRYLTDINVLENNNIIKLSNTKMRIRLALPESLKGYNKYEIVYVLNGEIKETIPATIEDNYIVFETTHLSEYGIVATNEEPKNTETNPNTVDNIAFHIGLAVVSLISLVSAFLVRRKYNTK